MMFIRHMNFRKIKVIELYMYNVGMLNLSGIKIFRVYGTCTIAHVDKLHVYMCTCIILFTCTLILLTCACFIMFCIILFF